MEKGDGYYQFHLTEELPFGKFPKNDNLELIINSENEKQSVTDIIIKIKNVTKEEGMNLAENKARNLTNLMSVKCNIYSDVFLTNEEFQEHDSKTKQIKVGFRVTGHPYRKFEITEEEINRLDNDSDFSQQIARLNEVLRCNRIYDWKGVIIGLYTVIKEKTTNNNKKYKFLRDALSHDELDRAKQKVEEYFGSGYFDFSSNDQFDFTSQKNSQNLQIEAGKFFEDVMRQLKM
jgi:hypothetical protein